MTSPVRILCWSTRCPVCGVGPVIASSLDEIAHAKGDPADLFSVGHDCPHCGGPAQELGRLLSSRGADAVAGDRTIDSPQEFAEHYRAAAACCERALGPGSRLLGTLLLALGKKQLESGFHAEARQQLERAFSLLEERGFEDEEVGQAVAYLAGALRACGDQHALRELLEGVAGSATALHGPRHAATIGWQYHLALACLESGDLSRAEELFSSYVRFWEETPLEGKVPDSIGHLVTRLSLAEFSLALGLEQHADVLQRLRRDGEARPRYQRALELWQREPPQPYADHFRGELQRKLDACRGGAAGRGR